MYNLKKLLRNSLFLFLCVLIVIGIPTVVHSAVKLTDKEYKSVLNRLRADRVIIQNNDTRWKNLKKSKPKLHYTIKDGHAVIQDIEIPIYKSASIKYKVQFNVILPTKAPKWFPFAFQLFGGVETSYLKSATKPFTAAPDVKIGMQFFSFKPLGYKFKIKNLNIGFNLLVGIKSADISLSYTLPKPLPNTSIHVYGGISYTGHIAYGLGISLNF